MLVKDLIDALRKAKPDFEVICSSDEEGNNFSPLARVVKDSSMKEVRIYPTE